MKTGKEKRLKYLQLCGSPSVSSIWCALTTIILCLGLCHTSIDSPGLLKTDGLYIPTGMSCVAASDNSKHVVKKLVSFATWQNWRICWPELLFSFPCIRNISYFHNSTDIEKEARNGRKGAMKVLEVERGGEGVEEVEREIERLRVQDWGQG